jgi:hypothetical protein
MTHACGGLSESSARAQTGQPCDEDEACTSSFCDRGTCAEVGTTYDAPQAERYGFACNASEEAKVSGKDANVCGGYRCQDGRCRSCTTDSACNAIDIKCYRIPDLPGASCGSRLRPDPSWSPVESCETDAECPQAGTFCDLNACVSAREGSLYGLTGCETDEGCSGYRCRQGRCLSCRGDSDCDPGESCGSRTDYSGGQVCQSLGE